MVAGSFVDPHSPEGTYALGRPHPGRPQPLPDGAGRRGPVFGASPRCPCSPRPPPSPSSELVTGEPRAPVVMSAVVALYTVAATTDRPTTWRVGLGSMAVLTGVAMFVGPLPWYSQENLGIFAWTGMAAAAGDAVRSRRCLRRRHPGARRAGRAPARRGPGGASPRSGCGSPAICTTSSHTHRPGQRAGRGRRPRSWTSGPTRPRRPSARSRGPAAPRSTNSGDRRPVAADRRPGRRPPSRPPAWTALDDLVDTFTARGPPGRGGPAPGRPRPCPPPSTSPRSASCRSADERAEARGSGSEGRGSAWCAWDRT